MSDFADRHVLPDVLEPGLKIVFCGTVAGRTSALRCAYYAGPGNKFWRMRHAVGLTPACCFRRSLPAFLSTASASPT